MEGQGSKVMTVPYPTGVLSEKLTLLSLSVLRGNFRPPAEAPTPLPKYFLKVLGPPMSSYPNG